VRQVIRSGITTGQGIQDFLTRLRAGEQDLQDDQAQGRTKSLGASLAYGFREAFTDQDRTRLAVLHLFHGTIDADALTQMGGTLGDDGQPLVPELAGLTRQEAITLLDKATGIGILIPEGGGYYTAHPALPWYFTQLFHDTYGEPTGPRALAVTHAYTGTIRNLGEDYWQRVQSDGDRRWLLNLAAQEANLLHALELARTHHWWPQVTGAMQGLRALYERTGRRTEWARLVQDLTPDMVHPPDHPDADQPLPGREDQGDVFTSYRIDIARRSRDWPNAQRLQHRSLDRHRQQATAALGKPADQLDDNERNRIRTLAVSLSDLADIQRDQGDPECISHYQEAITLDRRIGRRRDEATDLFNLGHAYLTIPDVRDLDLAEASYQASLNLYTVDEPLDQARRLGQLGNVALERYYHARKADQPDANLLLGHLNTALHRYRQALSLTPADAPEDLDIAHGQLGITYSEATRFDPQHLGTALQHYRQAIHLATTTGDSYRAGQTRHNAALLLAGAGRTTDARAWATAALRDYETVGPGAQTKIDATRNLIAQLGA